MIVSLAPGLLTGIHFSRLARCICFNETEGSTLSPSYFWRISCRVLPWGQTWSTVWTSHEQHLSRYPMKVGKQYVNLFSSVALQHWYAAICEILFAVVLCRPLYCRLHATSKEPNPCRVSPCFIMDSWELAGRHTHRQSTAICTCSVTLSPPFKSLVPPLGRCTQGNTTCK